MKKRSQPRADEHPQQGELFRESPPQPLKNVHPDFQSLERNLRRYVDYRFADVAPPANGTFYRRYRIEIWGLVLLLAILGSSFSDSLVEAWQSERGSQTPTETHERGTRPDTPPLQTQTKEDPAKTEKNQDVEGRAAIPPSGKAIPPEKLEELRSAPRAWWSRYLRDHKVELAILMQDLEEARELPSEELVSSNQKRNFGIWRENLLAGLSLDLASLQIGLFEYLLRRWQFEQSNPPAQLPGKVDLVIGAEEYPDELIRDYFLYFGLEGFGEIPPRAARNQEVQMAVILAWIEAKAPV